MITLVLLSMLVLGLFMVAGVERYGQLPSYSAYACRWASFTPALNGPHLWSLVTFTAAFLLLPPMIAAGEGNPLQVMGFFTPLYLITVSMTPNWETDARQHRLHVVAAVLCATCNVAWVCLVCHMWWNILAIAVPVVLYASWKGTLLSCKVFWGEVVMFLSAYLTVLKLYC